MELFFYIGLILLKDMLNLNNTELPVDHAVEVRAYN